MKNTNNRLIKLFNIISKELQKFNDDALADIISGKAKLKIDILQKKEKSKHAVDANIDYEKIKKDLHSISNREEGSKYLDQHCKRKKELTALAKIMDIPIQKSDKLKTLKEKIIESTIGFRLRSAAIQKKSSKNK